jgi:hypothetical protein
MCVRLDAFSTRVVTARQFRTVQCDDPLTSLKEQAARTELARLFRNGRNSMLCQAGPCWTQVTEDALALSLTQSPWSHRCEQFGHALVKSKKDSMSNWERAPLRVSQIAYAAQDAWVSVWLCQQLFHRCVDAGGARGDDVALLGTDSRWHVHAVASKTLTAAPD